MKVPPLSKLSGTEPVFSADVLHASLMHQRELMLSTVIQCNALTPAQLTRIQTSSMVDMYAILEDARSETARLGVLPTEDLNAEARIFQEEEVLNSNLSATPASTWRKRYTESLTSRKNDPSAPKVDLARLFGRAPTPPLSAPVAVAPTSSGLQLTNDQASAARKIHAWLKMELTKETRYFVLKGYAGTGKSFMMDYIRTPAFLTSELSFIDVTFSAPTNKAAGNLAEYLDQVVKTTHSLFGLRMVQDGEQMVLDIPEDKSKWPSFSQHTVLVIDEASYISEELAQFIHKIARRCGCRVMYVGDPAQLPPIGETESPVWALVEEDSEFCAFLKEVRRYDNQILTQATKIRECIEAEEFDSFDGLYDDHDENGGVFAFTKKEFLRHLLTDVTSKDFSQVKVAAWRNKTVKIYNTLIRKVLGRGAEIEPGDQVMIGGPVEQGGVIVANTDDEGVVKAMVPSKVHFSYEDAEGTTYDVQIPVTRATLQMKHMVLDVNLVSERGDVLLQATLSKLAALAKNEKDGRARGLRWKTFWNLKGQFSTLRFAYAVTLHRLQGSSLQHIYVDQQDVLANKNTLEAYKCLYVASTRPRTHLFTF